MNSKTHEAIPPLGECFICKGPVYQQAQQTKALQTCDNCKPVYEQYDSVKITRAYSNSGKNSARIVIFLKQIGKKTQHCLLQIKVTGKIAAPEDFPFKSEGEALKAAKAIVTELLGEEVTFEDIKIENPADPTEQLKLIAGIRKT